MRARAPSARWESLGALGVDTLDRLVEAAGELAVVLDESGTVLDVRVHDPELAQVPVTVWPGSDWRKTAHADCRDKLDALLEEAKSGLPLRWRQVNHPLSPGEVLPLLWAVLDLGVAPSSPPRFLALGRDLRGTVMLQQRLVEAQQAMERDYWRFREAETRYRNLFQTSPEAVLVVDGHSLKVLEVNPAAEALAGRAGLRLLGATLASLFDSAAGEALQTLLAAARAVGRREPTRLALAGERGDVEVLASLFRQDQVPFLLIRLMPALSVQAVGETAARVPAGRSELATGQVLLDAWARNSPDGLVFTDAQGRVLSANRAFATLAQLSAEEQARGETLDRWLGRTGVELSVLITNLRQRGSVGLFTTTLRGEFGAVLEVEISASPVGGTDNGTLAFAVRDIGRRLQSGTEERVQQRLARSPTELTELVGRVPMKDIVSETTELIEQLCIETALQMTQDNRALAAQLLGLSRQSLYVKMRRYGVGDLTGDNGS